ncbi:hypothetical protein FQN51_002847 [Onygenales sp. PD_10]|nr:hypothetical protein FQN51_002847 [Onygenales sp. PD_10]
MGTFHVIKEVQSTGKASPENRSFAFQEFTKMVMSFLSVMYLVGYFHMPKKQSSRRKISTLAPYTPTTVWLQMGGNMVSGQASQQKES